MLSQTNNDELQPTADAAAAERGRSAVTIMIPSSAHPFRALVN